MSHRRTWVLLIVAVCTVVVCFRQASAARDVPEVPMRRVCMVGVRVELSAETPAQGAATHGERRPTEIGDPCGPPAVQLGLPGARLGETDGVIGRPHDFPVSPDSHSLP